LNAILFSHRFLPSVIKSGRLISLSLIFFRPSLSLTRSGYICYAIALFSGKRSFCWIAGVFSSFFSGEVFFLFRTHLFNYYCWFIVRHSFPPENAPAELVLHCDQLFSLSNLDGEVFRFVEDLFFRFFPCSKNKVVLFACLFLFFGLRSGFPDRQYFVLSLSSARTELMRGPPPPPMEGVSHTFIFFVVSER